ncbi:hypothetical protein [Pseudoalteromonas phage XCL1123]|nr:hypothetical protein [Pseudoalteromonas phage XCL1123]
MSQMTLLNVKVPTKAHCEIASLESLSSTSKSAVARAALIIGLQELEGLNNNLGIDKLTRAIVNSERKIKEGK